MPFRRNKKKDNIRRHTVHNSAEFARQVHAASQLVQTHIEYGPNEVSVDAAISGRSGSIPVIISPSSEDPPIKSTISRKIPSKYSECLYLRYGSDMRRCPMPSPITLRTIKHLFINLFDLDASLSEDPAQCLFILDRSNVWKCLEDVRSVGDHCTILLVNSAELGILEPATPISPDVLRSSSGTPDYHTPSPDDPIPVATQDEPKKEWHGFPEGASKERSKSVDIGLLHSFAGDKYNDDFNHGLTRYSPFTIPNLSKDVISANLIQQAAFLCQSVHGIKEDLHFIKQEQLQMADEFQTCIALAKQRLKTAVQGISMDSAPSFRHERVAVESAKVDYVNNSKTVLRELEILGAMVENCRVDTVERRCNVDPAKIDVMINKVASFATTVTKLQGQFGPVQSTLKNVMKQELQVIVAEERFIEQESSKLEEAVENCRTLSETLKALEKFAAIQHQRSPHIPYYYVTDDVNKEALVASINAIQPEHAARMQSLQVAETIQEMKRQNSPSRQALRKFESDLQNQQQNLHPTGNLQLVESHRENMLASLYMGEKLQKQKEIENEIELAQKAVEKRRIKEVKEAEEHWKKEEKHLRQEESDKKLEIKRLEEERKKLEEQRKIQEEETKQLVELRKQHKEEQQQLLMEQRKQQEEKQKLLEQKQQQQEEKHKLEQEKQQWNEYQQRLANDSPDNRIKRREILWEHVQQKVEEQLRQEGRRRAERRVAESSRVSSGTRSTTPHGHPGYFHEVDWEQPPAVVLPPPSGKFTSSSHHNLYSRLTIAPAPQGNSNSNYSTPSLQPKFNSEDSLLAQNLYDLPWNSKRTLLAKKSGSTDQTSPIDHQRNHSDLSSLERNADTGELRQTPSPNQLSFSLRKHKIFKSQSLHKSLNGATSPLLADDLKLRFPQVGNPYPSTTKPHFTTGPTHQEPPPYNQVVMSSNSSNPTLLSYNGIRQRSYTAGDPRHRTTQYPVGTNPSTNQKPSISYV